MTVTARKPILCDCCGQQVMGYQVADAVVWYSEHHGKRHTVKIPLDKSETLSNTGLGKTE